MTLTTLLLLLGLGFICGWVAATLRMNKIIDRDFIDRDQLAVGYDHDEDYDHDPEYDDMPDDALDYADTIREESESFDASSITSDSLIEEEARAIGGLRATYTVDKLDELKELGYKLLTVNPEILNRPDSMVRINAKLRTMIVDNPHHFDEFPEFRSIYDEPPLNMSRGASVHLKSLPGLYKVKSFGTHGFIITCNKWDKQGIPPKFVLYDEFKAFAGGSYNQHVPLAIW